MEALFIYLAKASGLTALFFIAYYALLKKETFFTSNRLFLLAGLFTSVLLPLLTYTKIIWLTPQPAMPAVPMQQISLDQLMMVQAPQVLQPEPFIINWYYVALAIYAAGILFFMARFIIDLIKVNQLLSGQNVVTESGFKLIDSERIQSPFSFFRYIVYNSAQLQPDELGNIIAHEKVHSSQKHSLDILACQLFCIVFWFSPFAWLYKKAISQNLEFIADAEATKRIADKKAYQKTLLKITLQPECIAITNHFYQSLIKKRIVMLNKQQSKRHNGLKYALIMPALVAFVLLFQVQVVAKEKENTTFTQRQEDAKPGYLKISMDVNKDATDESLQKDREIFKQEFGANVTFSNIQRNSKGEIITIKVSVIDKNSSNGDNMYEVTSDAPIKPFSITIEREKETGINNISFSMPIDKKADTKITANNIAVTDTKTAIAETEKDTVKGHWSVNSVKFPNDEALIIINGVKQKQGQPIEIPLDEEIDKMDIYKNDEAKKYGGSAKSGVVVIYTTKITGSAKPPKKSSFNAKDYTVSSSWFGNTDANAPMGTSISDRVKMNTTGPVRVVYQNNRISQSLQRDFKDIMNGKIKGVDYKKDNILIDGKVSTPDDLEKLDANAVYSSGIMPSHPLLTEQFGLKANGDPIIIILTKDAAKSININDATDNKGFIINKIAEDKDLKDFADNLKNMNIKFKYSKVKRSKSGEITSIKIELVDAKNGSKSLGEFTSDKGIPDIYIGRWNGSVLVYEYH